jgi:hypothetical protein
MGEEELEGTEAQLPPQPEPPKKFGFDAAFAQSKKKRERRQRLRANRQALRAAAGQDDDNISNKPADDGEDGDDDAAAIGDGLPHEADGKLKEKEDEAEVPTSSGSPARRENGAAVMNVTPPAAGAIDDGHERTTSGRRTTRSDDQEGVVEDQQHQHVISRLEAQLTWGKERGVIGAPSGVAGDMSPTTSPSSSASSSAASSVSNSAANTATWLPDMPRGEEPTTTVGAVEPGHAAAGAVNVAAVDPERLQSIENALKELNTRLATWHAEREALPAASPPTPAPAPAAAPSSSYPLLAEEIERKLAKVPPTPSVAVVRSDKLVD